MFESILESVASQPGIETCKIDKSGNISTGNKNVQVKVKDGESKGVREGEKGREEGREKIASVRDCANIVLMRTRASRSWSSQTITAIA